MKIPISQSWREKYSGMLYFNDESEGRTLAFIDGVFYLVFETEQDFLAFKLRFNV